MRGENCEERGAGRGGGWEERSNERDGDSERGTGP